MRRLAIALISFNTLLVLAFVWWWVRVYATQQLFLEAALCGLGMFDYPAALANLDARGCDGIRL